MRNIPGIVKLAERLYHQPETFNEQIALMYCAKVNYQFREITLLRHFVSIGEPGRVSFDSDNPGTDSKEAWDYMESALDDNVCGFFHTHPEGHWDFSAQDIRLQHGIAKAQGSQFVWYGVQDVGSSISQFVCCWMSEGRVFRHVYNIFEDDLLFESVIKLKLPDYTTYQDGAYIVGDKANDHVIERGKPGVIEYCD